jgi:hypothetical protein
MQDDNPKTKIGDVIEISCTQCRLNLDGTVAAMVDDEVVQVTCRTCGNTQKFAPPMDEEDRRKRVMKRVVGGREKKRATQERSAKDMICPLVFSSIFNSPQIVPRFDNTDHPFIAFI